MIPSQLIPSANHLWQSTLFAGVAGLLTLFLRKNRAHVRYGLWLMASVKFLFPFSILVAVGGLLERHTAAAVAPSGLVSAASFVGQLGEPFTTTVPLFATPAVQRPYTSVIVAVLIFIWAIGFITLACRWTMRWRRMRASVRKASPLDLPIGLPVRSSPAFGEPGVFGIFRPVLLLPDKILIASQRRRWNRSWRTSYATSGAVIISPP
jgi:beta-lactamase regulating signal transducer with metallopeptidase domain